MTLPDPEKPCIAADMDDDIDQIDRDRERLETAYEWHLMDMAINGY